ncbi:MAG: hsp70 family protein, partial [Alphaproteobacteria bacterium PA3]
MFEALGLDFGTTNTVAAIADGAGGSELIEFQSKQAAGATFRSALCFWEDGAVVGGIDSEAGPWAIEEFLETPSDCRFVQSFKSVVASPSFERALIFNRPMRFEDMGQLFLRKLVSHARGKLDDRPRRVIVGRPVEYAGAQPDSDLARARYRAMFRVCGVEVRFV